MKSYILVVIQFITIGLLLLPGQNIPNNILSTILIFSGTFLGGSSIWIMHKSKFNVLPDVSENATLITNGPYKYIRHPMYTGLILIMLGLLFNFLTPLRILIFVVFLIDILFKLSYEEKLLEKHFEEYKNYEKNTKRLIPYIF